MKPQTYRGAGFSSRPVVYSSVRCRLDSPTVISLKSFSTLPRSLFGRPHKYCDVRISLRCRRIVAESREERESNSAHRRRDVLVAPFLAIGVSVLQSALARAEEKTVETSSTPASAVTETTKPNSEPLPQSPVTEVEKVINSRIYDATVIGEPLAVGKDKRKVWEKLMNARIVYLGEAEQVPIRDDKELELEILKNLKKRCTEAEQPISLAMEAFPSNLQDQLNQFVDKK